MKKSVRILALVLSLVMVASCFVACSDKKDEKKDDTSSESSIKNEAVATADQTVEDYYETLKSGNIKGLRAYCADDETYNKITADLGMDSITEMFADAEELGLSKEYMEGIITTIAEKLFVEVEYEIIGSEVNDDEATVEVTMSYPDYDSIDENALGLSSIDPEELLVEALISLGYNETSMAELTQEDIILLMPSIVEYALDIVLENMETAIDSVERLEESCSFKLQNIDGVWLITDVQ